MSVEDNSNPNTQETISESIPFTPLRTDMRWFLRYLIRIAKEDGLYGSLDGFEAEETEEAWETRAKEGHDEKSNLSYADALEAAKDLIDQACQASASPSNPSSPKRCTAPSRVILPPTVGRGFHDSNDQTSSSRHKLSSPKRHIVVTRVATPPIAASIVSDLCSTMDKTSLCLSDQPSARRIKIPQAYKFSISVEPKCHYDEVALFNAGTGNRQIGGEKRKCEELGFKPLEVIRKGTLYVKGLDLKSTLSGEIHPIFNEKHWTDCPHHVYAVIKLALLLLGKFLTTPQCLQHFLTVLKGERKYCVETSFRKQKTCYRIRDDVLLTPESIVELKRHIQSMNGSITFQFLGAAMSTSYADKFFATARMVPCNHSSCSITTSPQKAVISLRTDFYIQAQKLCRLQYPDPAQVLRFQLFTAINLIHEFAHAFEFACSPDEACVGREVFMYDWQESESGRAVEKALFGGWTTVTNSRVDGLHGLCVVEWPDPGFKDRARRGQTEIWSVPMEFVNNLFQESYWEGLSKKSLEEKGTLNVPRTGAKSVGISTFSTASFVEVLKEREMGDLELAVRDVERVLEVVTEEEGEREFKRVRSFVSSSCLDEENGSDATPPPCITTYQGNCMNTKDSVCLLESTFDVEYEVITMNSLQRTA